MEVPEQSAAHLYAAALREALTAFTTSGGTQRDLARALNVAPATLSRYLSGERVAPRDFLRRLRGHLDRQGMPWTPEEYENLDALCGQAHASSGSPAVQLAQLREELARLRSEQEQAQQVAEERLTGLEEQAGRLAEQLEEALERARAAEARVAEQDETLRHGQAYIHQVEAELALQREQARLLQQEVGVLREQNRRLVEERPRVAGASTQDTSFEATLAARHNRQERIAQEQARLAREASHRAGISAGSEYSAPTIPRPVDGTQYRPARHTIVALTCAAAICVSGATFAAGLQATPGPAVWKLVLTAVIGLFVSAMCWGKCGVYAEDYARNHWAPDALDTFVTFAGPLLLAASTITPFILDTDVLGHWLADIVGLL
ncbi:helix-turn-helix domain-containing protein [Streptomyces nojiriensis]|uniref:helix-turn-helix domain-containing protein n=1 Tax=Streptomyces nojiriensis TaxID=66374 RepID=UPI0035DC29D5